MANRPLVALKQRLLAGAAGAAREGAAAAEDERAEGAAAEEDGGEERQDGAQRAAAATDRAVRQQAGAEEEDDRFQEGRRAAFREEAQRYGWTDKETFAKSGRNIADWREPEEFLTDHRAYYDRMRNRLRDTKERMARNAQAAADAIEEANRRARTTAAHEVETAAEAGDLEGVRTATRKLADTTANATPPETLAWIAKNPWFNMDPIAAAAASAECDRLHAQGKTRAQQLQAAEDLVRRRFPEHFDDLDDAEVDEEDDPPPRREASRQQQQRQEERRPAAEREDGRQPSGQRRLSEVRVPETAAGSRMRDRRQREKTFADIPAADQALYHQHFARSYSAHMKPEDAEARYAKAYWARNASKQAS